MPRLSATCFDQRAPPSGSITPPGAVAGVTHHPVRGCVFLGLLLRCAGGDPRAMVSQGFPAVRPVGLVGQPSWNVASTG
jgi:hypothetical protein